MNIKYNQQPTLLIGLGGTGSRIVDNVYGQVKEKHYVSAFCIDTDISAEEALNNISKNHFICTSMHAPISTISSCLSGTKDWFPHHPMLHSKTLAEGAGQIRAVSRLAYENTLQKGAFKHLLETTFEMAKKCTNSDCRMRVSITTTLAGGTGAGIFIQVALLIREYIGEYFPSLNVKIHGEFVLPSNFGFIPSAAEKRNMEAIAYASLKELNAINEHFFSNGPALELNYSINSKTKFVDCLPYDYCFLYDRTDINRKFNGTYIENAIIERLFGSSANTLNDAFVDKLRTSARKRARNLYGIISSERIPINVPIQESEIYRSITNGLFKYSHNQIFVITTPESLNIDPFLLSDDTILTETIDDTSAETVITSLHYGIEISSYENFKYLFGQYYMSYKTLINRLPQGITPHINLKWHVTLPDIGCDYDEAITTNEPQLYSTLEKSFVFISYSTKEAEIAKQTKRILETNGISCWIAPQSIPAGSDYATEIPKAIENCNSFLLLLSQASQESNWVPKEVGLAISKGKIIVPFQIDNAAINDSFNFYLTNSQRISAYNRMTEAYQELTKRLLDFL